MNDAHSTSISVLCKQLAKVSKERTDAQARIKELEDFIDKAFEAHSNLDLDTEALDTTNE
jgi:hypothetical protein